jgi:glyoxylase-like metal-dependent hydrolase (beta-lactamase superfamily II)
MDNLPPIERFESHTGVRIYRMPVEAFPQFIAYTYLLLDGGVPTLVDCGSGMDKSNTDLVAAFQAVRDDFGESISLSDIERIIITHGHVDHHGGLNFVHEQTPHAEIGIHPLDRRIITAYEERVVVATKNLRVYMQRAGVSDITQSSLIEMYGFGKRLFKSEKVDFLLEESLVLDGMRFYHVPGHCPGQVCIQIGDVMLTADHILSRITPHQAPESITHSTGLSHYFSSLEKISRVEGIRLALGGHEQPIHDLYQRIEDIKADHQTKLEKVCHVISKLGCELTISDISKAMYPDMKSYNILLALEEVGAHVEYLYERGELSVVNLHEVEKEDNPALRYCVV